MDEKNEMLSDNWRIIKRGGCTIIRKQDLAGYIENEKKLNKETELNELHKRLINRI